MSPNRAKAPIEKWASGPSQNHPFTLTASRVKEKPNVSPV